MNTEPSKENNNTQDKEISLPVDNQPQTTDKKKIPIIVSSVYDEENYYDNMAQNFVMCISK